MSGALAARIRGCPAVRWHGLYYFPQNARESRLEISRHETNPGDHPEVCLVANKKVISGGPQPAVILPLSAQDLLTVHEVAAMLRVSVSTVRSWVLYRRINFVKLQNKLIRFRRSDIDALIASSIVRANEVSA